MAAIDELIKTVKALRGPNGCPWDKKQTINTLNKYIVEEAYELIEALDSKSYPAIREELGDVLLHVVMLSNMAEERAEFNFNDVANEVNEKMIRRHPHVFENTKVDGVDDVLHNWEAIKKQEKQNHYTMDSIPKLPGLMKAEKIQKKAAKQGFDWLNAEGAAKKLQEECQEFQDALSNNNPDNLEEEAGDILFSIVNCLRKANINPEEALQKANNKFMDRYTKMEKLNDNFEHLSLDEKEVLWNKAKSL